MPKKQPPAAIEAEALALIAKIKALSIVVARNEDGQDSRWQLLQSWLASNPQYRKLVERCIRVSPADALVTICAESEIDLELMRAFDPNGALEQMAINTIATLQQLYRERAEIAQGEITNGRNQT